MTENTESKAREVVEKRVTGTVIRRRAKKKTEEKPTPPVEAAPEAATPAEAPVEPVKKPERAQPEVVAKEETPAKAKAPAEEAAKAKPADGEEEAERKAKEKPKKTPSTRRTRDDLLMEEYSRAGGLKKAAELSTDEVAGDSDSTEQPMERIFQPERQQRRGKRVSGRKDFKKTQVTTPSAKKRKIRINGTITVGDFANAMSIKGNEVVQKLVQMGSMVTVNDRIDIESAEIIAGEYGFEVENVSFQESDVIPGLKTEEVDKTTLVSRAPVVTVMGHVDHGKTSLLDYIRKTKVASGEAGGITQHIGAYQVSTDNGVITFIDTPGHEAFTAMRARGAQVTDIVILVVAADDGVKPQTIEAINHAKAAEVPLIVALNKIDKPGINVEDVKRQLSEHGLLAEDWGGDIIMVPVSAQTGEGIDTLLEMLLLQAEVLELKANAACPAEGYVVEARLEKGRGPMMTVIIKEGTLKKGDPIVSGNHGGRVRAMHDSSGAVVQEAGPATPVEIIGLSGVPSAGDELHALKSDEDVKKVIDHRQDIDRDGRHETAQGEASIDDIFAKIKEGEKTELKVLIRGDVDGSVEALKASLERLTTEKVGLSVIHAAVGAITESDVMLAEASQALVIGFNVRPDAKARKMAEQMGIKVNVYRVIYDAIEETKKFMEGLLEPTYEEEYIGRAEVRDIFNVSKAGTIAGSSVVDGKITRGCSIRVLRDGSIVYEGKLSSLKRFKDDAKEVAQGYECGIGVENFNDIKVGDVLEAFQMKEVAGTL